MGGRLEVLPDAEEVARAAAALVADRIDTARARAGAAHVALAGGTTPRRAYELLAERVADWTGVELWFGDERCVDPGDPESNARLVHEALVLRSRGRPPRIHRMEGELPPTQAAGRYEGELRAAVPAGPDRVPILDLALLGLGEDGHTASLFPNNPALDAAPDALCVAVHDAPKPPPDRLTLTLSVLRAAREVVFLGAGDGKADAVARALAGPDPGVPASLLQGEGTRWILDRAAAAAVRGDE